MVHVSSSRLAGLHQRVAALRALVPGVALAVLVALASAWISDHHGGPTLLYALLIGMAFNFLAGNPACQPGIALASRQILRLGVALLGARITATQVMALGWEPALIVVVGVLATMLVGWWLARRMGLGADQGLLTGGAVGICGASAALAIAAILPRHENSERNTIHAVVGVTALSTLAMILYPPLSAAMGLNASEAGIFLGATIHDVAQVVAAGYSQSDATGDVATLTKMLRVAMLVPVVFSLSLLLVRKRGSAGGAGLPWFLVVFVLLIAVNSVGWLPAPVIAAANETSRWCLVVAISALGIKTSFGELATLGWRPVSLLLAETVFLAALTMLMLIAGHLLGIG